MAKLAYNMDPHSCMHQRLLVNQWRKIFCIYSITIGALYGSVAAAFMTPAPHPKPNIIQAMGLVSRYTLLIGSAGAVFAGSTCALASIRDKDDYKNWAFGGAVAGSIFGIQARRIPVGLGCSLALAGLGALVKYTEVYKDPLPRREMP